MYALASRWRRLGTAALLVAFARCARHLVLAKGLDVRPGVALASSGHRRSAGGICALSAALDVQISWQAQCCVSLHAQIWWQAQRCVNLHAQISWQAQRCVNLEVQISWQAQRFVNLHVQIS